MESRWIPLILCLSVVETIIRPVTGTTIYNRESGLLPSFDDPENVPKDVSGICIVAKKKKKKKKPTNKQTYKTRANYTCLL